jgi:hypothetical protein
MWDGISICETIFRKNIVVDSTYNPPPVLKWGGSLPLRARLWWAIPCPMRSLSPTITRSFLPHCEALPTLLGAFAYIYEPLIVIKCGWGDSTYRPPQTPICPRNYSSPQLFTQHFRFLIPARLTIWDWTTRKIVINSLPNILDKP